VIRRSNNEVGGRLVELNGTEYMVGVKATSL
jgi:hypothetical protein